MAQQQDAISPAISSAMQMKRTTEELQLLRVQTEKARGEAESATAKGELDQFRTRWMKTIAGDDPASVMPMMRALEAEVGGAEARQRKDRLQGDIMGPMGALSERMGEFLPILLMLSQLSPGGILKGGSRKAGKLLASGRARQTKRLFSMKRGGRR